MTINQQLKLKESDAAYFLCISALLLFFISDACNKFLIILHYDFYRVSIIFRSLYEILFFSCLILFINETRLLFLKIFLLLFLFFLIGQLLIAQHYTFKYNYLENISIFNKYFFVFIIYMAIYKLIGFPDKFQRIIRVLELIFIVNSAVAVAGFIFGIDLFRTYTDSHHRYGYSGLLPAQNEATLFYFLGISHFYYKHFILKLKSKTFFFMLLSSLLLGTKSIYLFLGMLLLFHFLYHSSIKTKLISLFLSVIIFFGVSWYLTTRHAQILLSYFISKAQEGGWFTMLMSGRNYRISLIIDDILRHWNIINYLIGGQDQTQQLFEMDLFDMFFFLGLVGSAIFTILYFSTLFRFNILKPFNLFFVVSFSLIAFMAGHFFSSAVNALYLCLVSLYFYETQRSSKKFPKINSL